MTQGAKLTAICGIATIFRLRAVAAGYERRVAEDEITVLEEARRAGLADEDILLLRNALCGQTSA